MIEITPYKPFHAYLIFEEGIRERDEWLTTFGNFEAVAEAWAAGPSFTASVGGFIVCCAGLFPFGFGRAEAWMIVSNRFRENWRAVYRAIKKGLPALIEEHQFTRVQAVAAPGFAAAKRFLGHLGFEEEGLLRKYGPRGDDACMFGRIC